MAVVAVALTLALTVVGLGQVVVTKARAQSAADLAALSAATRLSVTGDVDDCCDLAGQTAARNDVSLIGCRHEGAGVVTVDVGMGTPFGIVRASARAGPSSARDR